METRTSWTTSAWMTWVRILEGRAELRPPRFRSSSWPRSHRKLHTCLPLVPSSPLSLRSCRRSLRAYHLRAAINSGLHRCGGVQCAKSSYVVSWGSHPLFCFDSSTSSGYVQEGRGARLLCARYSQTEIVHEVWRRSVAAACGADPDTVPV